MHLTKRYIDKLKYEGDNNSRHVVWDDLTPGFGIRVYPSEKKSFILSYRVDGRKRQLTVAKYGELTLKQAEKRAKRFLVEIADGNDPLSDKNKRAQAETMKDLCNRYMNDYAKPRKKSWKEDQNRINNRITPQWGNHKVISISRADVSSFHNRVGADRPYEANRLLALLSKIFDLALQWGYVPSGHENPAHRIEKYKEQKRDRWVTPEELPKLAKAIGEEESIYVKSVLWMYLFTGMRKTELLSLRWSEVDLTNKQISLSDTKAGRPLYLPLSEPASKILSELPRLNQNPYVFPGQKEGHHLVNISKAWIRVRTRAEIEDVRLHDLRRTVGSWLAQAGNDLHLIGRVLNHSNPSTTAIYARFGQDHVRTALDDHAKRLLKFTKSEIN